jgi:O-antigen/teichoic acid export membrane protein
VSCSSDPSSETPFQPWRPRKSLILPGPVQRTPRQPALIARGLIYNGMRRLQFATRFVVRALPERRREVLVATCANGASAVAGVVCLPDYLDQLGLDAMGFVGVFFSLLSLAVCADFGIGALLSYRIAAAGGHGAWSDRAKGVVRTATRATLLVALTIVGLGALFAGSIGQWLLAGASKDSLDARSLGALVALSVAARMVEAVFRGGMIAAGWQRRAALATLGFSATRLLGASVMFRVFGPALGVLVWWHSGVLVLAAVSAVVQLRRVIDHCSVAQPASTAPEATMLDKEDVRYSLAAFATSLLSLLFSQADRLILQGRVSESDLAVYFLTSQLLLARGVLVGPLAQSAFIEIARAFGQGDVHRAVLVSQRFARLLSSIMIPPLVGVALLPQSVIFAYTGSWEVAEQASGSARLLGIAAILNALSFTPFYLERAAGRVAAGLWHSLVGLIVSWTVLVLLVPVIGIRAAGVAQIVYYALYLIVFVPRALRVSTNSERVVFFGPPDAYPLLISLLVTIPAAAFGPPAPSRWVGAGLVATPTLVAWLVLWCIRPRPNHA